MYTNTKYDWRHNKFAAVYCTPIGICMHLFTFETYAHFIADMSCFFFSGMMSSIELKHICVYKQKDTHTHTQRMLKPFLSLTEVVSSVTNPIQSLKEHHVSPYNAALFSILIHCYRKIFGWFPSMRQFFVFFFFDLFQAMNFTHKFVNHAQSIAVLHLYLLHSYVSHKISMQTIMICINNAPICDSAPDNCFNKATRFLQFRCAQVYNSRIKNEK